MTISPESLLVGLEEGLGYAFQDRRLLLTAVTHTTFANEHPAAGDHNERLEFLGDAVLGLVAAHILYQRFANESEGSLTRRRARIVRRESLAVLATELDLSTYLRLGEGQKRSADLGVASVLADAYEAVVGAVFLDGGFEAAVRVFGPRLVTLVEATAHVRDAKTVLQELCHQRRIPPPRYHVVKTEGPDHARVYHIELTIDSQLLASAVGSSRKTAEQSCAEQALVALEATS